MCDLRANGKSEASGFVGGQLDDQYIVRITHEIFAVVFYALVLVTDFGDTFV